MFCLLQIFRDVPNNYTKIQSEQILTEKDHDSLVINLNSELCMNSNLVGNKAKSLFQLKKAISMGLINDVSIKKSL